VYENEEAHQLPLPAESEGYFPSGDGAQYSGFLSFIYFCPILTFFIFLTSFPSVLSILFTIETCKNLTKYAEIEI